MANPSPIEIQKYLAGMDYPASKDTLVRHAREKGANQELLDALDRIPDREYEGPSGVSKEIAG